MKSKPLKKSISTAGPSYDNPLAILKLYIYLKQKPAGVLSANIKNDFFDSKDFRSFQRIVAALRDSFFDNNGDAIFRVTGEGQEQKIAISPTHQNDKSSSDWMLYGLALSSSTLSHLAAKNGDDDCDVLSGIQYLKQEFQEKIKKNSKIPKSSLENLDLKICAKKVGSKRYCVNDISIKDFDKIIEALFGEYKIEISYKKRDDKKIIAPLTLVTFNDVLYLLCQYEGSETVRTLSIDRISKVRALTNEFYKYPKNYNPNKILEPSFGIYSENENPQNIKLKFPEKVAYFVRERYWHSSQIIDENKDGSITLKLFLPIDYEFKRFVLGFGSQVKVLAPKELKDEIREEAERILNI